MGKLINLIGKRFGRLKVVSRHGANNDKKATWNCLCDCGSAVIKTGRDMMRGQSSSCGCLRKEQASSRSKTHGKSGTPTYRSWQAMKDRCCNKNNSHYQNYGGSGIAVCQSWKESFENFLSDMGHRPKGMTIDRIRSCGNYEPSNCRWASASSQANNTRRSKNRIIVNGTPMTAREAADKFGVKFNTIRKSKYNGQDIWPLIQKLQSRSESGPTRNPDTGQFE